MRIQVKLLEIELEGSMKKRVCYLFSLMVSSFSMDTKNHSKLKLTILTKMEDYSESKHLMVKLPELLNNLTSKLLVSTQEMLSC